MNSHAGKIQDLVNRYRWSSNILCFFVQPI